MPKVKTPAARAAGKLVAVIQKEWIAQFGEPGAEVAEQAMNNGHELLQAANNNSIAKVLQGRSVADYVGTTWVRTHPSVLRAIQALEDVISS